MAKPILFSIFSPSRILVLGARMRVYALDSSTALNSNLFYSISGVHQQRRLAEQGRWQRKSSISLVQRVLGGRISASKRDGRGFEYRRPESAPPSGRQGWLKGHWEGWTRLNGSGTWNFASFSFKETTVSCPYTREESFYYFFNFLDLPISVKRWIFKGSIPKNWQILSGSLASHARQSFNFQKNYRELKNKYFCLKKFA